MAEITRERLAYLRHQSRPLEPGEPGYVTVRLYAHELRALLNAADERDRLREELKWLAGAGLSASDAAVVSHVDGKVSLLMPNGDEDDDIPPHAAFIVAVAIRAKKDARWRKEMVNWLERQQTHAPL